jgi:hypothetical protein
MGKTTEKFIVGRGRLWLKNGRPDLDTILGGCNWSQYVSDAKKFDCRQEAKRKARKVGGVVYRFYPFTWKVELLQQKIPEGAVCNTCRGYRAWDGTCINPESEYYRVNVSYQDVCEEWGKGRWTKKTG